MVPLLIVCLPPIVSTQSDNGLNFALWFFARSDYRLFGPAHGVSRCHCRRCSKFLQRDTRRLILSMLSPRCPKRRHIHADQLIGMRKSYVGRLPPIMHPTRDTRLKQIPSVVAARFVFEWVRGWQFDRRVIGQIGYRFSGCGHGLSPYRLLFQFGSTINR